MAEEDEIDVLGDFSFNSCFAQNNQGIPSCSSREDTVHPQWLLDSPATNWYDIKSKNRLKGRQRKLCGTKSFQTNNYEDSHTSWSREERDILNREMEKHGRNINLIALKLTSKTTTEIQALIDAEYGISLDTSWEKHNYLDQDQEIVSEEVVCMSDTITMVTTGTPTITVPKPLRKANIKDNFVNKVSNKNSHTQNNNLQITKHQEKIKTVKKIGNHRRKVSRNYDNNLSPARPRNDSSQSEDSVKSPKLQIVLGSGQALPVSEGEQVIKIEKKKDSEQESDIEIDVDSDTEVKQPKKSTEINFSQIKNENEPVAIPLRKLETSKRRRKINLNGGGGYRIMHTEAGDLYEVSSEPRKERQPRKPTVHLMQLKKYGFDKPAPCEVQLKVSVLLSMDIHSHTSQAEVMGLLGGQQLTSRLLLSAYAVARAAANSTHCDMDPVSQASAGEYLTAQNLSVCGWHHSHPQFPALPSKRDLSTQQSLQDALEWRMPFLALVTSPAPAPHFRCFRVEDAKDNETPIGYQLDVTLVPDLTVESLPEYVQLLKNLLKDVETTEHSINLSKDKCPHTGVGYLDKCIWSISRHMRTAGYESDHPVLKQLIQDVRHIFR